MRWMKLLFFVLIVIYVSPSVGSQNTDLAYDQYKVIYEYNVFSKDRRPPQKDKNSKRPTQKSQVLSIFVLRGVAAEAGRSHKFAFIEEQVAGQLQIAKVGTEVLSGKITDIQLDHVLYEKEGEIREIRIGEEFGSTQKTVLSYETEEKDNKDIPRETIENSDPADEDDVLRKLIERRKRELGS